MTKSNTPAKKPTEQRKPVPHATLTKDHRIIELTEDDLASVTGGMRKAGGDPS